MAIRINTLAGLVALATTIGLAIPAQAQNFSDVEALISQWLQGHTMNDMAPSQAAVRANIDTRKAQIEAQINAEVTSGRLTPSEAQGLRAESAALSSNMFAANISDGGLTIAEARDLLIGLRSLAQRVQTQAHDSQTTATVGGNGNTYGNNYGHRYGRADRTSSSAIDNRIDSLQSRIQTVSGQRQIRRSVANQLNANLTSLRNQLQRMNRGGLTVAEEATLNTQLASLETRFNSAIVVAPPDTSITSRIADLRNRLNTARTSMGRRQFIELSSSVDSIDRQYNQMQFGGLSAYERSTLESALVAANAKLNSSARVGYKGRFNRL